ncbi:MAG: cob(I)yrinic acid a,c-diamide adenosyltransferase [Brumimicrobium sp.]|nr:cob(I)yrinic acid a,c-diamide adenosyltransferase [Brumimicrobium sp.]
MKVYTKTGDKGTTALIGGKRVAKNDIRVETYGTVDELNSWVGLLRDHREILPEQYNQLIEIQDRLFTIETIFASQPEGVKMSLPPVFENDIIFLENAIDEMNDTLPPLTKFVLPGGSKLLSFCHIARCVCRRAERLAVGIEDESEQYRISLKYLNRLSDYLFVLTRKIAFDNNIKEVEWQARK